MQRPPLVSVVITSYNHELFVARAIESVLAQEFQDWELVIRDDGSSDGTPQIVASYRDSRIRNLGTGANLGASLSANECLRAARGTYVAILNSDDIFEPHKLAVQVAFLNEHPEIAAVFSQARLIRDDGTDWEGEHVYKRIFDQQNRTRHQWLNRFFYEGNCLCDPSVLVRRSVYDEVGMYDARLASLPDFDLWIRTCLKHEIHVLPEKLVQFRIRSAGENESGDRPANAVRIRAELACCLGHFRELSPRDFALVFASGVNSQTGTEEPVDVEFALARHCLAHPLPAVRHMGTQLLLHVAADPQRMRLIHHQSGYGYTALHRELGRVDPWGAGGPAYLAESHLYPSAAETGGPVKSTLELGASGSFHVRFEIRRDSAKGTELFWTPLLGHACAVRINAVHSNLETLAHEALNAHSCSEGVDLFFVPEPQFRIFENRGEEAVPPPKTGAGAGEDPGRRVEWVMIEGHLRIVPPVEIMQYLHDLTRRLAQASADAQRSKAAASAMKKEHKGESRLLRRLLSHHASSPFRALSLWWNRKSVLDSSSPPAVSGRIVGARNHA